MGRQGPTATTEAERAIKCSPLHRGSRFPASSWEPCTEMLFALLYGALLACRPTTAAAADHDPWLCRPGRADPCSLPLPVLRWEPDGSLVRDDILPPAVAPSVDCFYVYPTVDHRLRVGNHTDLDDLETERAVTRAQAAALSSVCQVWTPVYRQVTIGAYLRPDKAMGAFALAWQDVQAAWGRFLAEADPRHDIVLIGHSQGGQWVTKLLAEKVEPDPALSARLLAAYPVGWGVGTEKGSATGGSFTRLPLCTDRISRGCVMAYRSYADGIELPARGTVVKQGDRLACVNPVEPGTTGGEDRKYPIKGALFGSRGRLTDLPPGLPEGWDGFITVEGAYEARCERQAGGNAGLAIRWAPPKGDRRTDLAELATGRYKGAMGAHVLDLQFGLLDIVEDIRTRSATRP